MATTMRTSTLETLGLGTVLGIFERGRLPVDRTVTTTSRSLPTRSPAGSKTGCPTTRDRKMRPGMLLNVELALPAQQLTLIPAQSVEYAGEQRFVYRLEADGRVKRVPVVLGETEGETVWVTEGLKVGDRIVVEGLVNLRDGVQVRDLAEVNG